jgi:hypothetical protein
MPNRAIATLRRAKFDVRVRGSRTENPVHGWSLPYQEDEYTLVNEARCSNKYLSTLSILSTFLKQTTYLTFWGQTNYPPSL